MEAASFDQANFVYDKPEGMTHDQCFSLSVFRGVDSEGQPVTISCWKMTADELEEVKRTGRVWCFHYGNYLQPHALAGINPWTPPNE